MDIQTLETIGAAGHRLGKVAYQYYKLLRDELQPSEESIKAVKKAEQLTNKLQYKKLKEAYICDVFNEIAKDDFPEFVNEYQKRHELDDKAKGSMLDAVRSDKRQGSWNDFEFDEGKGKVVFVQVVAMKSNGKVNLAFAQYTLSYELSAVLEEWFLFGFIRLKSKVYADKTTLTISEEQKEIYRKMCQAKLYSHVNEKCRSNEIEG